MNPSIPDIKKLDVASSPFLAGDSRASSSATPFGDALDEIKFAGERATNARKPEEVRVSVCESVEISAPTAVSESAAANSAHMLQDQSGCLQGRPPLRAMTSPATWPCGQGPCQSWDDHTFEETYYGHKCTKCGLFYAHGCAPWEDVAQEHPKEAGILGRSVPAAPERVHEGTATISSFAAVRVEGPPAVRSEQALSADVCSEFYLYAEANQFYRHGENAMNRSRRLWQIRCALARIRWYWIMPVMFFAFLVWLWATVLTEATK